MCKLSHKILYKLDFICEPPQFRIFKESNYKSNFSSLISFIVILLSIAFFIYSLIDFLEFNNPIVVFSKDNDKSINRTISLKNTLLIFGVIENINFTLVNDPNIYFTSELVIRNINESFSTIPLTIEKCEYGKNIDLKYRNNLLETFNYSINDFFCLNNKDGDIPLYYFPEYGVSSINIYSLIKNESKFEADDLFILIINGNDAINHNNKKNPILENYFSYSYHSLSSSKLTLINFYFQFIKYESDTGLIFPNYNIFYAKSFSHITALQTNNLRNMHDFQKGTIIIEISKINFDLYKRSYPRLDSFLAEVMSVIDLLLVIGKIICDNILEKKISKDIVEYLFNNNIENKNISNLSIKINEISDKDIYLGNKDKSKDFKDEINFSNNNEYMKSQSNIFQENETNQNKKINSKDIIKKVNYFYILKSYFCFKDKKTKLINLCHELVCEDICIERIFDRLYKLEKYSDIISKNDNNKFNFTKNKKFEEINQCISQIENSMKNKT